MRSRNRNRLLLLYVAFFLSQCYPKDSHRYTEAYYVASGDHYSIGYLVFVFDWLFSYVVWFFTEAKAEERIAFFTFVLTVATIGLWIATWRLFKSADNTSRTQLRAYISQWSNNEPTETADGYQVVINIRNGGVTPGFVVGIKSKLELVVDPKQHVFAALMESPTPQRFMVFPNSDPHSHGISEKFTPELIRLFRNMDAQLHIRGRITYKTLGKRHRSNFHLHYAVELVNDQLMGGWRYFEGGDNTAD